MCVCNKKKQEERRRRKIDYSWDSNTRNDEPSKKKKEIRREKSDNITYARDEM